MIDRQLAIQGGYQPLLSEAIAPPTASTAIFNDVPAGCVGAMLTVRGGTLTVNYGSVANGAQTATATNGNDYPAGTYDFVGTVDFLRRIRAIGPSVTSLWVTSLGPN